MRIAILHNFDFVHLPPGVARRSQDEILGVVAAVQRALETRGATIRVVPVALDPVAFAPDFLKDRPEVVVNLCESLGGDSRGEMLVPGLLDLMDLPYTGSGPLTLGLALHKHMAKELLRARGVPTPEHALIERPEDLRAVRLGFPLIVKPAREDASIGIDRHSVVHDPESLASACERVLDEHAQPALVERYIEGRELNVALLGHPPQVLPLAEIDFEKLAPDHPRIVTYAAKWDEASPEFIATPPVACKLSPDLGALVSKTALAAFDALGCRDYGRVDIRLAPDGTPYVIEVNPNCDLSPDAGFARAARAALIDYDALIWRLVQIAKARDHAHTTPLPLRPAGARANARADRRLHAVRGELRPRAGGSGAR
jgi:D-alanine-D-alanine ligase